MPNFESFKNSKQFLVMSVVIQLHYGKSAGVKSDWINFIFLLTMERVTVRA